MASFRKALEVLNSMKREGVIEDYAVAGAVAILFWTEPVPTYDLDVLVFLPASTGPLVSLDLIYRWTEAHGYTAKDEHVLIEGVPTQFVPSPSELADAAIQTAETLDYEGVPVKVARPERSWSDMASRSDRTSLDARPRPTAELLRKLRAGKAALRQCRAAMPLREKVRQLLELQRLQHPILARQRPLRSWERPWDIEP
jgi:hypothetical protein